MSTSDLHLPVSIFEVFSHISETCNDVLPVWCQFGKLYIGVFLLYDDRLLALHLLHHHDSVVAQYILLHVQ